MFTPTNVNTTYSMIVEPDLTIPPKVYIDLNALAKMEQYVQQCDKEIGWLAFVEKEDDAYIVTDTVLLEQKVTGTTTELEESFMNDFAYELISQGRVNDLDKIRCWGHSHVNMGVSPSGTDDQTFEEYYKTCNFFIRIIANKKGEMRLDIAEPERGIKFYNVKWQPRLSQEYTGIQTRLDNAVAEVEKITKELEEYKDTYISTYKDSIATEIKSKVKPEVTTYSYGSGKKSYGGKYSLPYNYYDDLEDYDYNYGYLNSNTMKYYNPTSDASLYEVVPIFKGTKDEEVYNVEEIFELTDIEEIALLSAGEVRKLYEDNEMFKGYTYNDWINVVDACTAYCERKYEEAYEEEKKGA